MRAVTSKRAIQAFIFSFLLTLALSASAGRSCKQAPIEPQVLRDAAQASTRVAQMLSASGEQVALLARIGQDLSQQQLLYSHAGFAVRDGKTGAWQVTHLLNVCGSDKGKLVSEGLLQFYLDDLLSYQTKWVFFTPKVATELRLALERHQGRAVFQPNYSVIARTYSGQWQNSTAWVLELIAAALVPGADSRAVAFQELRRRHYQSQTVRISYAQRLGATFLRSNIHFIEHPIHSRVRGRYQTSSVRSIVQFLRWQGLLTSEHLWFPPGERLRSGD